MEKGKTSLLMETPTKDNTDMGSPGALESMGGEMAHTMKVHSKME